MPSQQTVDCTHVICDLLIHFYYLESCHISQHTAGFEEGEFEDLENFEIVDILETTGENFYTLSTRSMQLRELTCA